MKTEKTYQYRVEVLVAYAVNGTLEDNHSEVDTKFIYIFLTQEQLDDYEKSISEKLSDIGNYKKM